MANLFDPLKLRDVTLKNRIVVSPMCNYVAIDGVMTDWHRAHYAGLARGGAGLVVVEATAVSPEGRISPGDSGLWNDEQAVVLAGIASSIETLGAVPGIQLAHAGRKASANRPWEGDDSIPTEDPRGWETLAPSAIALGGVLPKVPREITLAEIERVKNDYVAATKRAAAAGFKFLQLHFAHGYLAASFLNSHSNHRTDAYGGNLDNRARFIRETIEAVRAVWPQHLPFSIRLGVIEFDGRDEETVADSIAVAKGFKAAGVDQLDISMGFTTLEVKIPWGTPAFLAPTAEKFRREIDLPLSSSWGFDTPEIAQRAVSQGPLDLVFIGKAHLANPHWAYHAARKLGVDRPSWTLPAPYAHWLERYAVSA
ncbi:NADH:flavin oxidoreductase/NADH oxidase [Mesorhizobium sp.]|uniref:NADH:flavin oxidoreductase/NADH oxidase n=1 Tax=Mesorhizobium sp. TaxID=1871066 RepID=UPI000FE7E7B7|nr:NADH:flavin oxidoreductase/NADH oxidase [Mesorhizobium sp.]RWE79554.1 MAG: NADH:flavin oxidoreductase/NADH oxidase [Mesorhizobium sp.]